MERLTIRENLITLFALLFIIGIGVNIQKNEKRQRDRAERVINEELSKFSDYKPIRTSVRKAKLSPYNDFDCRIRANILLIYEKRMEASKTASMEAKKLMLKTADKNFAEREDDFYEKSRQYTNDLKIVKSQREALKEKISGIDTSETIGWEVTHDFKYVDSNGEERIAKFLFILDKNIRYIVNYTDVEDSHFNQINDVISRYYKKNFLAKI